MKFWVDSSLKIFGFEVVDPKFLVVVVAFVRVPTLYEPVLVWYFVDKRSFNSVGAGDENICLRADVDVNAIGKFCFVEWTVLANGLRVVVEVVKTRVVDDRAVGNGPWVVVDGFVEVVKTRVVDEGAVGNHLWVVVDDFGVVSYLSFLTKFLSFRTSLTLASESFWKIKKYTQSLKYQGSIW